MHRSSNLLRPAMWLFDHSTLPKLAQCSELLGYPILDTLCRYIRSAFQWPQSLPVLVVLDSAFTPRRLSVVCIHPQRVVAIYCRNVTHTEVPIANWALVSLD